jgi:hypothetical protein
MRKGTELAHGVADALFAVPPTEDLDGPIVHLPLPVVRLPREKHVRTSRLICLFQVSEEAGNHLFVESCIPLHDYMYIIVSQDNATVTLLSNSHVSFLQLGAGTSLPRLVAAKVGADVTLTDIAQNAEVSSNSSLESLLFDPCQSFSSMVWTSLPGLVAFTKSFGSCGGYIVASKVHTTESDCITL